MSKVKEWVFNHLPSKVQTQIILASIKEGRVKQITFDEDSKKAVSKMLGTLRGRKCHFCSARLNQENWAGASKGVWFCDNLVCLFQYSDYSRHVKGIDMQVKGSEIKLKVNSKATSNSGGSNNG